MHLVVKADVNDGDYINETTPISDQKELDEIIEIIKEIPKTDHNYEDWEWSELKENFEEYMPSLNNEKIHTITSIDINVIDINVIEHIKSLL